MECLNNHELVLTKAPSDRGVKFYTCSVCNDQRISVKKYGTFFCRECDYDVCTSCQQNHPEGISPVQYKRKYPPQNAGDLVADDSATRGILGRMESTLQTSSGFDADTSFGDEFEKPTVSIHDSLSSFMSDLPTPQGSLDMYGATPGGGGATSFDFDTDQAGFGDDLEGSDSETTSESEEDSPAGPIRQQSSIPTRSFSHRDFPFQDLTRKYRYKKFLGKGAYGKVIEATCLRTGKRVAIKKIEGLFRNKIMALRQLREIRLLRELRKCMKVCRVLEVLPPKNPKNFNELFIVLEYYEGDLNSLRKSDECLVEIQVQYFLYQILLALKYIHSCNIVHRDLKPENVLLNTDCSLAICDFGLSRSLPTIKRSHSRERSLTSLYQDKNSSLTKIAEEGVDTDAVRSLTTHVVTRFYRAPEVLLMANYTTQIDLWSVGCIFADLLGMQQENVTDTNPRNRKPLFPGTKSVFTPKLEEKDEGQHSKDQLAIIASVIGTDEIYSSCPDDFQFPDGFKRSVGIDFKKRYPGAPPAALDLLRKFLHFDPKNRINVDQALEHPYFEKVRDESMEIAGAEVECEFESRDLKIDDLRRLILGEIKEYNTK